MARVSSRLLASFVLVAVCTSSVVAYTHPDEVTRLFAFRDKYINRSSSWQAAMATWTCPTPSNNSVGSDCDPCGEGWWANWDHMSCRRIDKLFRDDTVPGDGYITNIHFSLTGVEGTPPDVSVFNYTKEWDFKVCNLNGTLPISTALKLPHLEEWDFSRNHMVGTIPSGTGDIPRLVRFKMQGNHLTGPIPESWGQLSKLEWIRIFDNELSGTLPSALSKVTSRLTQISLGGNNFEGTLYPLADVLSQNTNISFLPKMCGMIPQGISFGYGYDVGGSDGLGLPCDDELNGWPEPTLL